MKKRFIAVTLSVMMLFSSNISVFAEGNDVSVKHSLENTDYAKASDRTGYQKMETEEIKLSQEEFNELLEQKQEDSITTYSSTDSAYWKKFGSNYYYNKLTAQEKSAWNELEQVCISYATNDKDISNSKIQTDNLYFANWNIQKVYNFIHMFKLSHPQFYFLSNRSTVSYCDASQGYMLGIGVYSPFDSGHQRATYTTYFCNKIDNWVEQIKQKSSSLVEEREKYAFDLICANTTYEDGTYDQSAFSLVYEGKTVCAGYAATFQLLMNAVGIDTIEVTSYDHAWNLSNVHGVWYEVDATWADNDSTGNIDYSYYNKSEATISENGYETSHVKESQWDNYQPEAKYDSDYSWEYYYSPYFNNGNYTWFMVNSNSSLSGGYLATPVNAFNGATYGSAPSTVKNDGITYSTLYLKKDPAGTVTANDMKGLKIGGRAVDALRLNWDKDLKASGYIVEQYSGGSWKRIARMGSNATTTLRVEKLLPSTTYKFRVRTFVYSGNTPVYGKYAYVNGKTNPSVVSGLKIGGTAKDALRLNWSKNNSANGYIIEQYKDGSWKRIKKIESNSTVTYRVEKLSAGTTYKFRVMAYGFDGNTPLYSAYQNVSGTTTAASKAPSTVSDFKIGGRATDALRLNWTKNNSASGYIIEQNKNGSWTRIARIASNATITYRVEGLKDSTTYQFRIKAFGYSGNTALYSGYKNISGTTLPAAVSGVKIGGTAKDALRLNWNKNRKVSGYIIEQYSEGKWVRIARIGSNSTTTYRVEKLKSKTSYVYRIKAFDFDGSTAIYGNYSYISGVTN